ncbi:MAG: ATP-binding protein [Actinomycetota bacterium]|nr:MAG: putative ATPase [Actinomycetota bacterium]MDO8950593.1 ATP-binding protein [Actinomycetota bacterium]MDP3629548.1 ATP-binding protein [Actinomycetota bacterium]
MDVIEQLIVDFQERSLPTISPRLAALPDASNMARIVIGMRRSGKTYRLFQEMQRLVDAGVDKSRLLYINFEDDRLQPSEPDVLDRTLETFYRLNPTARSAGAYLFLDEIQVVDGWSRFARRVLDTESARLYVSGSSAKMLSTEVATEFRGRGYAVELLPLSFAEALLYSGVELPAGKPGSRMRSQLEAAFTDYLRVGGFPDVQHLAEAERIQTLQDYVQLVLLRDIIDRHEVRNVHAVRFFALSLLQASGSLASVSKLANNLKSRGIAVGKDTLYDLLDYFIDAFLLFTIPVFDRSLRVREVNPKKVYAIDPGLAFAVSPAGVSNLGARLENAVYLELRRRLQGTRDGAISYYSTAAGHEIDFIIGDPETGQSTQLLQVCADLSTANTREREVRALVDAMGETGLRESTIVTMHDSEDIIVDSGIVHVVPAWDWMLDV